MPITELALMERASLVICVAGEHGCSGVAAADSALR